MFNKLLLTIFGLACWWSTLAQINVNGLVTFGSDVANVIPDWPVDIYDEDNLLGSGTTATDGQFSIDIVTTINEETNWSAAYFDACTGAQVRTDFTVVPEQTAYTLALRICENIAPPPPVDTCQAFFSYTIDENNPLRVQLTDLSTATASIDSLYWDFGDGGNDTDASPSYTYTSAGEYYVSLTIFADGCISTAYELIRLFDPSACECPDTIATVCVIGHTGEIISFDNACLATCAGYDAAHSFSCDNECGCPTFISPICVVDMAGDTLNFTNHCFAECAGYGAGDWVHCAENDNGCDCENEPYAPVCTNLLGLPITFNNLCEAACAGIPASELFDCEDVGGCDCPDTFDPVCVQGSQGDTITFDNRCLAWCEGYFGEDIFRCTPIERCICPADNSPICLSPDFTGGIPIVLPNPCVAECLDIPAEAWTDCGEEFTCDCPEEGEPVCVLATEELIITFNNACEAACYGFTSNEFVDCTTGEGPEPCLCDHTFDPVCVVDSAGDTISYNNPCLATCAGYSATDLFECEDCFCEAPDFPVCYFDAAVDSVLTFDNFCDALCIGISPDELFPCQETEEDCKASFTSVATSADGLTVQFTNTSFSTVPITSVLWEFGDGNVSGDFNPIHTYAEAGMYEVRLTITNPICTSTEIVNVMMGEQHHHGPDCQAFFFFEHPDTSNFLTYQFIDFSIGNINSWFWNFGDGTTSTTQNPLHTFSSPGDYNVALTVTTEDGCESNIIITIKVQENIWYGDLDCRAWFLPIIIPDSNQLFLVNFSSGDAVSYNWDFGDGTTSTERDPWHQYAEPGIYTITLSITTDTGCINEYEVTVDTRLNSFAARPAFNIISSTVDVAAEAISQSFQIVPNPTTGFVNVELEIGEAGQYDWYLYNINGQLLQQGQHQWTINNTLQLDLTQQTNGIYIVQLKDGERSYTLRISKL